jgi:hypothetical protein
VPEKAEEEMLPAWFGGTSKNLINETDYLNVPGTVVFK